MRALPNCGAGLAVGDIGETEAPKLAELAEPTELAEA